MLARIRRLTGVGRIAVAAQEEHERLTEARLNDTAEWLTVHIDPCFTPGIIVAKIVQPSRHQRSGQILPPAVRSSRPVNLPDEADVFNCCNRSRTNAMSVVHAVSSLLIQGACCACSFFRTEFPGCSRESFSSAGRQGKNDDTRAIGGIEAHDDVPVGWPGPLRVSSKPTTAAEAPALIITTGYDGCCVVTHRRHEYCGSAPSRRLVSEGSMDGELVRRPPRI